MRGDAALDSDLHYNIRGKRRTENGDAYEGENDAVRSIGDERRSDGHGAHNDALCEDMYVEEDSEDSLISLFILDVLILKLKFIRNAIDEILTIIFDPSFPVKKMEQVGSCYTDCEKQGNAGFRTSLLR